MGIAPIARKLPRHLRRWSWLVVLLIIVAAVYWSVMSIRAVRVGEAFSDDLAHAWQTTWNVAYGHGFQHSHIPLHHNAPRLATHADYIFVLLAPFAWLWPHYETLMVLQAIVVAIGAWFIFLWARRWLKHEALAATLAVTYLCSGMVQFPVWWQFHGVTLAMTFILAMTEAIAARRRWWVVVIWFILALITKEQVGLILGPLAWVLLRKEQQPRLAWGMLIAGWGYSLIHYLWILPAFAPTELQNIFWQFYFGTLGTTPRQILPLLLQPTELWRRLWEIPTADSLIVLLLPVAFLPLLEPITLLALVALLPHWLADPSSVNGVYAQNHVLAVPILWVSAMLVLRRWQIHWQRHNKLVITILIVMAVLGSVLRSPNPWSLLSSSRRLIVDPDLVTVQQLANTISHQAIVGYSWGMPPIWQSRETVYVLPHGLDQIEYAVVHPSLSPLATNFRTSYYQELFQYFDHSPAFTVVYRSATIGLYRRVEGQPPGPLPTMFQDPTTSWNGDCDDLCPTWHPSE